MQKGELRKKILDESPDEFLDTLVDWVDDLESMLVDVLSYFDIGGVDDLHKIEDAKREIEDITDGLY